MASDPITWTALKTSLANWLDRDDMSTTEIPEAIALFERRVNRLLRVPEMEDSASSSVSGATITLPTDFLELRAIYIDANPKVTLEPMSLSDLRSTYSASTTGKPQNYALQSGGEMVLGPSPDATYTIVINYYASLPALGSGQATNWLLTSHPDIYIAGALAELYSLLRDENGTDRYEAKVAGRLEELRSQAQRKARGASPLRIRSSVIV